MAYAAARYLDRYAVEGFVGCGCGAAGEAFQPAGVLAGEEVRDGTAVALAPPAPFDHRCVRRVHALADLLFGGREHVWWVVEPGDVHVLVEEVDDKVVEFFGILLLVLAPRVVQAGAETAEGRGPASRDVVFPEVVDEVGVMLGE